MVRPTTRNECMSKPIIVVGDKGLAETPKSMPTRTRLVCWPLRVYSTWTKLRLNGVPSGWRITATEPSFIYASASSGPTNSRQRAAQFLDVLKHPGPQLALHSLQVQDFSPRGQLKCSLQQRLRRNCRLKALALKGFPRHVAPHVLPQALQPPHHMKLPVRKMFEKAIAY